MGLPARVILVDCCSGVPYWQGHVATFRKETDRRWEQGQDLSLVEFKSFEYQQSKQVVAWEDIKNDILKIGIRRLERDAGVSHHTLGKILKGEGVRRKTLAKIMKGAFLSLEQH